jgi:hypothetical protein
MAQSNRSTRRFHSRPHPSSQICFREFARCQGKKRFNSFSLARDQLRLVEAKEQADAEEHNSFVAVAEGVIL